MSKVLFRGIYPAFPTPLDQDEKLIKASVKPLMDYELDRGVNGFYVGGATGEGPVLPAKTRIELCETAVEACAGRGKILLQVGGPNWSDVKTLIAHANSAGVDALSSMAPNAYYAHNDRELVNYYKAIADETDLPVFVYVTPLMLGSNLTSLFEELVRVPNIIGLKFTLPDYYKLSLLKMVNGGDINVFNGPDEMLLCGLSMGADGGIGSTYNLMPERFVKLYKLFSEGKIQEARQMQYAINRVIRVLLTFGSAFCLKNLKEALTELGFDMGSAAFPCAPMDADERKALLKAMREAGFTFGE